MIKFSVFLTTYNRHELLQYTLKSLRLQTYKDFEIILIDNGSDAPVDPADLPVDLDISLIRHDQNQHASDFLNELIEKVDGTHFALLADDDVWTSRVLERAAEIFKNREIQSLGIGFSRYHLGLNQPLHNKDYFHTFTGHLEQFDAWHAAIAYCSFWGIGPKVNYLLPRMAHPSASFFAMGLVKKTIEKQGQLLIKPLGDVGFVGCCFHQKNVYYLDLPLVVLGEGHSKDLDGSRPGQRMRWMHYLPFLEFTPLKACSFINMGVEGHLKMLHRNGIHKMWDCALRSDFFLWHLAHVASDDPWTDITRRDIEEAVPFAVEALDRENNCRHPLADVERVVRKWIEEKRKGSSNVH